MSELVDKTASSLAIVEKKSQRPGGCVGIFFQLFDWNRRFAKKKLFSKKLLPPVRMKQAAKKFGGDEKQPKLRLIADENSGGFPNSKKNNVDLEQRQEMRTPSLVARLMGLESMPTLQRDKSKKAKADKLVDSIQRYSREDALNVEKGGGKNELRPQKLQKTGGSEKQQQGTRFGAESLPFKNVLTKSKRNHHPKLPIPAKSPRNFSRSKLIGAATRILEPRLQTSRSKFALTYSSTSCNTPMEEMTENLDNFARAIPEFQPSCRNCGHSLDESNPKRCFNEKPLNFVSPPSHCVGFSYQEVEKMKMGHAAYYGEFEEMQRNFSSKRNKSQRDLPISSLRSNRKSQSSNYISRSREIMPPRSKFNTLPSETNFGSFSRSVNGSTRPQISSSRMDNCKFEMEKRIVGRQNELVRKRRPTNISRQSESSVFMSFSEKKQIYGSPNGMSANGQVDNNVVSFTFNSRAKQKIEVEKERVQIDSSSNGTLQRSPPLSENGGRVKFVKPFPLSGDALGVLLEQKLRELNSQGEDIGGNAPKKTTAMILEELIAALTSEVPFQLNNPVALSHGEVNISNSSNFSNPKSYTSSKANEIAVKHVDQPLERERLSPGSVLEAYCSNNDSCCSSSLDDNSEILDSAISITTRKSNKDLIADILDDVSEALRSVNLDLKGIKLDHAKEVLLNSELMFQNSARSGSVDQRSFSINHFLLDEMATLATVLWMNFSSSIGIGDLKEVNQLKRFTFDSVIEYLEMIFKKLYESGSKVSTKLPQCINTKALLFEIVHEVKKWEHFSQFVLDELIEMEMGLSYGEWTRFDPDIFDTSIEISNNVFQFVLDEILMDLCSC